MIVNALKIRRAFAARSIARYRPSCLTIISGPRIDAGDDIAIDARLDGVVRKGKESTTITETCFCLFISDH